jgi:hypothetical protein
LVLALEDAWSYLRGLHPDMPDAVTIIGTGKEGKQVRHGHWHAGQWTVDGQAGVGEFFLAGEAMKEGAEYVFGIVLHEAAHAIATARGIKDTSRGGRYHNKAYADLAIEVGLEVEKHSVYGWTLTTYRQRPDDLGAVGAIADALRIERPPVNSPEPEAEEEKEEKPKTVGVECACPRKFRVKEDVLSEAPIICGACNTEFLTLA